jgi:plastocyanin
MRLILAVTLAAFAFPALAADHAVEIKGMKFNPAKLDVAVGDTVTFTNADGAPHTGTALDGSFDTGRLNKGQSGTVTISAAGTHDYKCAIHTSMKGQVTAK